MATAHVQTKDAQAGSATTLAVNLTSVGSGNHLATSTSLGAAGIVVAGDFLVPTSTPSATWASALAAVISAGADCGTRMDYSENVASGSWTVNGRANTSREITCIVSESSGVATSASKGTTNSGSRNTSGTTQASGSITPATGSILYTSSGDNGGSTTAGTIDSGFAVSSDATAWNGANQRAGHAHKDNVANSAVNPVWTVPSTVQQVVLIAEFLAAAGTGLPPGLGPTEHMQPAMTMPIGW